MALRVLIAEDAPDVAEVVAFGARMTWPDCTVMVARDGASALRLFAEDAADLVILDVQMPSPDGFEVCRRIRATSEVPILMLTVRDSVADKIRALDLGADDYVTKPFDHLELLARLRALARRTRGQPKGGQPLAVGDLELVEATHEANVAGRPVRLTDTEYRLLETLMRHAGTPLSHRFILEQVWGSAYAGEVAYLKVFVRRLRRKLGDDPTRPRYIATEWGSGYRFIAPR